MDVNPSSKIGSIWADRLDPVKMEAKKYLVPSPEKY